MNQAAMFTFLPPAIVHSISGTDEPRPAITHLDIQALQCLPDNNPLNQGQRRKPDSYEIIWLNKGSGILSIDGQEMVITSNMVYCIMPGQRRMLHATSALLDGYYIGVSAEFMCRVEIEINLQFFSIQSVSYNHLISFPIDEVIKPAEQILLNLKREFAGVSYSQAEVVKSYFKIFMLYLSVRDIGRDSAVIHNKDSELVRQFMSLLKSNYRCTKKVSQYAGDLFVTPPYLNRIVKKVSGFTASHHIQQYIILEAKRMALSSRASMKEIAYALGFNDSAHFSKFFKSYTGVNFSSFRQPDV